MRADVLLLAGDPALRELVVAGLRDAGHAVTAVGLPEEALALLAGGVCPQVLVLDWEPVTGRAFVATSRQVLPAPWAPIVVLTAGPMERTEALEAGAAACLAKPVELAALAAVVARAVRPTPAAPVGKDAAIETIHLRRLRRLSGDLRRARDALAVHRAALRALLVAARHRPLTAEEAALVGALRQEQAELRWELRLVRREFEAVQQTTRDGRTHGGVHALTGRLADGYGLRGHGRRCRSQS